MVYINLCIIFSGKYLTADEIVVKDQDGQETEHLVQEFKAECEAYIAAATLRCMMSGFYKLPKNLEINQACHQC